MVGIAFPGTFMLDADGRVTSRHFQDSYIERNTVSSIIMRLGESRDPVEAVRLSTPQMDLTTYVSEPTLAAGNRFALMLSVEPKDGMHIYAPGEHDYQVISLEVEPHQQKVRVDHTACLALIGLGKNSIEARRHAQSARGQLAGHR